MALYTATVSGVTNQGYDVFGGAGEKLLNTTRIFDLKVRGGTGSIFHYSIGRVGDQRPSCVVISTDTVASIVTEAETLFSSNLLSLSEYPDRDISVATETIYLNAMEIVVVEAFTSYTSLVYSKGRDLVRIYVDETLDEIITLANEAGGDEGGLLGEDEGVLLGEDGEILLEE